MKTPRAGRHWRLPRPSGRPRGFWPARRPANAPTALFGRRLDQLADRVGLLVGFGAFAYLIAQVAVALARLLGS